MLPQSGQVSINVTEGESRVYTFKLVFGQRGMPRSAGKGTCRYYLESFTTASVKPSWPLLPTVWIVVATRLF